MKKIILILVLFFSSCITVNINNCECPQDEKVKEEEVRAVPGLDAKRKLNTEPRVENF